MIKHWLRIALPALAIGIASCGGGGGGASSAVPAGAGSGPTTGGTGNNGTTPAGKFIITIPNSSTASGARKPAGISAGASSVSIAVTGVTAAQNFDVSASSTNCTATPTGRSCTLSVQAGVGPDTFTVTVFDGPNATGHQLGSGTASTTVTPGVPFSVTVSLQGIIASLGLIFPGNAGGGSGPPVGQSGSGIAYVAAKDASGNYIIGPFNTSVNVTSSDPSITCSPCTVSGTGQAITFTYDGTQKNAITLTATSGSISGTFVVLPTTNIVSYLEPLANDFRIHKGPDGAIYTSLLGPNHINSAGFTTSDAPGEIARFDPVAKTFSTIQVGIAPTGFTWTPDGVLWVANSGESSIGRATTFSQAAYTSFPIPIPVPSPNNGGLGVRPRDITVGSDGKLWFNEIQATCPCGPPVGRIGTFAEANPSAMTLYPLDPRGRNQTIRTGSDGNLWVPDQLFTGNVVDKVSTAGTVLASYPIPGPSPEVRFEAPGTDGNMYVTGAGPNAFQAQLAGVQTPGKIYKITPSGTVTTFAAQAPDASIEDIEQGPPGTMIFTDLTADGIGLLNMASGAVTEWPIGQGCLAAGVGAPVDANAITPDHAIADSDGSIWYTQSTCFNNPPASHLSHLIFAAGWQLYPVNSTIYLSPVAAGTYAGQQLLGIAESGDSSPFTVVSSNTAVVGVTPTSSSHDFLLTAAGPGTATILVTDKNGLSTTKKVSVTAATATIQSILRRMP